MAINITDGFYLGRAVPIDTRMVVSNSSKRIAIKHKYDGLRVFQTDTRESWIWNNSGSTWELETSGISGSTGSTDYLAKWSSSSTLTSSNISVTQSSPLWAKLFSLMTRSSGCINQDACQPERSFLLIGLGNLG